MGILARPRLRAGKDAQRQVLQRGEPQRQVAPCGKQATTGGTPARNWLGNALAPPQESFEDFFICKFLSWATNCC